MIKANCLTKISILFLFLTYSLLAAIPVDFALLKMVYPRKTIKSVQVNASTTIFNNENPENNLTFDETILIKDFKDFLTSVTINKNSEKNVNFSRIVKFNFSEEEYFVEGSYLTLKIKHPVSPMLHLLFSKENNYLKQLLVESKIDIEIIGLGRYNVKVNRFCGAKEQNTYRRDSPPILAEDKNELLEEHSQYKKIKPQIWMAKDTFYLTRYITKTEASNNLLVNDIHFKNYALFDSSQMFPRNIEIYRNGRLYCTTAITEIKINPLIKKSIFELNSKFKKRTFSKMVESFSPEAQAVVDFIQLYR